MRKIVNGVVFDSKKSVLIGKDIFRLREVYRTKGGRFFGVDGLTGDVILLEGNQLKRWLEQIDLEDGIDLQALGIPCEEA